MAAGATLDGAPAVRANLDGDVFVAAQTAAPRRIRRSLDDATNAAVSGTPGRAAFPLDEKGPLVSDDKAPRVSPPAPQRVFRVALERGQPAFAGRLIRLSLDEGRTVYGRLGENALGGRRLRTTLD